MNDWIINMTQSVIDTIYIQYNTYIVALLILCTLSHYYCGIHSYCKGGILHLRYARL